jgi:hypothetical protein
MPDVKQVIVQIKAPKGNFHGQVAYGYYTLEDGVVTMTDQKGVAAVDVNQKKYSHKLLPGEDSRAVACRLTKQLRNALRGTSNKPPVNGFDAPISYAKSPKCV